jgi:hypothetical protein
MQKFNVDQCHTALIILQFYCSSYNFDIWVSLIIGGVNCDVHSGEHEVRCVKRRLLLEALAKELPSGTIRLSSKVVCIEESGFFKLVHLADGTVLKSKVKFVYLPLFFYSIILFMGNYRILLKYINVVLIPLI